jgi:molecular chaperone GrpE
MIIASRHAALSSSIRASGSSLKLIRPFFSWRFSSSKSSDGNAANGSNNKAEDATKINGTTESTSAATANNGTGNELETKLKDLEKQNKELKDHYLRALADAENLRERTRREKELAQQLAIKSFAVDLLSVSDVLDIALQSVPVESREDDSNPHLKSLYTGLSMTHAELLATFKRHGLESFDATGKPFDPNMHQAMFQAPIPDKQPGTVFQVTKKGFTLHNIVVRAAQVGVVQ